MTVITTQDLNKEFNSVVAKYLNDGYILAPIIERARCSQSPLHVSLANPKNKDRILCVWLLTSRVQIDNENIRWAITTSIVVKEYEVPNAKKYNGYEKVLYNDEGKLVCQKDFYELKSYLYTDDVNELISITLLKNKRDEIKGELRRINTNEYVHTIKVNKLTPNFIDSIMERINKIHGFKRATASCIEWVKLSSEYSYYGKHMFSATVHCKFNNRTVGITLN